jgi:hypothetical protein
MFDPMKIMRSVTVKIAIMNKATVEIAMPFIKIFRRAINKGLSVLLL